MNDYVFSTDQINIKSNYSCKITCNNQFDHQGAVVTTSLTTRGQCKPVAIKGNI